MWLVVAEITFSRSGLHCSMSVGHNHNHRNCLALSYKIVKNLACTAEIHPLVFISTHTMEKVENRISGLSGMLVSGWGIDIDSSVHLEGI